MKPCLMKPCLMKLQSYETAVSMKPSLMKLQSHETYATSVFDSSKTSLLNFQRYKCNTLFFNSIARYVYICPSILCHVLPSPFQIVMLLCWFPPLLPCMSLEDIFGQCTIICGQCTCVCLLTCPNHFQTFLLPTIFDIYLNCFSNPSITVRRYMF